MALVMDSYPESNQNGTDGTFLTRTGLAQSFTGDGGVLDSVVLYLNKTNSPTGTAVVKIYAHTGTFGSTGTPTGAALATSGTLDVSTLTTSLVLKTFTFSGAERITLTNGTKYFLAIEYSGDSTNFISVGEDNSSPSHGGNRARLDSGVWGASTTADYIFYVYKEDVPSISPSLSPSVSPSISASPSASPSVSPSLSPSALPASNDAVLKIAKPGVNVLTNSDVDKLIFSSEYGTLKYYTKVSINTSFDANTGDISSRGEYTHSLGYYPFVEVYVSVYIGAATGIYEYCPFQGAGASVLYEANVKVTTDKVTVYGQIDGVSTSVWHFDFIVFIFKNNLQL